MREYTLDAIPPEPDRPAEGSLILHEYRLVEETVTLMDTETRTVLETRVRTERRHVLSVGETLRCEEKHAHDVERCLLARAAAAGTAGKLTAALDAKLSRAETQAPMRMNKVVTL